MKKWLPGLPLIVTIWDPSEAFACVSGELHFQPIRIFSGSQAIIFQETEAQFVSAWNKYYVTAGGGWLFAGSIY